MLLKKFRNILEKKDTDYRKNKKLYKDLLCK